jgi:triosephosphate isomerase (TIM)
MAPPPAPALPTRRPLVSGNWKMHHDHLAAMRTVQELGLRLAPGDVARVDVSVHPPFCDLRSVQTVLEDRAVPVVLGAQHCHDQDAGPFTGEVSPPMLARLRVAYVIVGHSERRRLFGETDEQVASRVRAVLRHDMTPILCVGETEAQRDAGQTETVLEVQLTTALSGLPDGGERLVVAYEPIWAIGTGRTATAEDAQAGCAHVRAVVAAVLDPERAALVRVQYGGSVTADTAGELVAGADVDGLLVGGASLAADAFAAVVKAVAGTLAL